MEKIWVNNKGNGWFMTCKGKDMQGNEIVNFMNVGFKKDHEPKGDSAFIEIVNGFHTPYQFVNKNNVLIKGIKYFILDYKYVEKKDKDTLEQDNSMFGGEKSKSGDYVDIKSEDSPFY